jgi:hypothetical protein
MDEHREGIQADKPIQPWERPGCFRRDGEPHRSNLLWWLADVGYALGVFAWFTGCSWVTSLLGTPFGQCNWIFGLLGILFNLCIRYLAQADLAKMQAGLMDPAGEGVTASAVKLSNMGLVCSVIGTVIWGGLALLVWWSICRFPP